MMSIEQHYYKQQLNSANRPIENAPSQIEGHPQFLQKHSKWKFLVMGLCNNVCYINTNSMPVHFANNFNCLFVFSLKSKQYVNAVSKFEAAIITLQSIPNRLS